MDLADDGGVGNFADGVGRTQPLLVEKGRDDARIMHVMAVE